MSRPPRISSFFFFNDTATTEIYTLSLHDALPIYYQPLVNLQDGGIFGFEALLRWQHSEFGNIPPNKLDRKSTRLNSSHLGISYAVFCLKKKKTKIEYVFLESMKMMQLSVKI